MKSRSGPHRHGEVILNLKSVGRKLDSAASAAAAEYEAAGVQADRVFTLLGRRPFHDQFKTAPDGKFTATAEIEAAGADVMNCTDSPAGSVPFGGQAKVYRKGDLKASLFAPVGLGQFLHSVSL